MSFETQHDSLPLFNVVSVFVIMQILRASRTWLYIEVACEADKTKNNIKAGTEVYIKICSAGFGLG